VIIQGTPPPVRISIGRQRDPGFDFTTPGR
jgi:hypothetical protein